MTFQRGPYKAERENAYYSGLPLGPVILNSSVKMKFLEL